MGQPRYQRVAGTDRADHLHARRNGLPDGIGSKPDEAVGAIGDHHMGYARGLQGTGTLGLIGEGLYGATCPLLKLLQIGFDQGRCSLDPFGEGRAAAIEDHLLAFGLEQADETGAVARLDALGQAARQHEPVGAWRQLLYLGLQRGHFRLMHGEPRQIEIRDPARLLGDLHVDPGAACHAHEMIVQGPRFKQGDEALLIVSPEPAGQAHVTTQVFEHHGDVDPLARGAQVGFAHQVHLAEAHGAQAGGEIQRRIEGDGNDVHQCAPSPRPAAMASPIPLRAASASAPSARNARR
ncbi:hypothetical protein D3C71_1240070 [compost metagenome]